MSTPSSIPPVTRLFDQSRVDAYASAARDGNPVHVDAAFARRSGFDGTIVHGMLVLALVSEAMGTAFGARWAAGGALKVRWRAPALVPATVTARAVLRSEREGAATYDVTCEDAGGALLLSGTASVPLAPSVRT